MKKLLFAAVAALAMIGAANATPSYGISAQSTVSAYSLDTAPGDTHVSWYSFYIMKQADAQTAMGRTGTAVDYNDIATWLGENFADNKQSVINNAEQITQGKDYVNWQLYQFYNGLRDDAPEEEDLQNAIGVCFYNDDKNLAYNVFANIERSMFTFDSTSSSSTSSGWQAVSVPEPTSGLLLLLGVAGLALKRKRA